MAKKGGGSGPEEFDEEKWQEREKANYQKKKSKFDATIRPKVEALKQEAQVEFKKGSYAEAIVLYKKAEEMLEIARNDFIDYLERELAQMEAAIFSNLAFCYSKD